MTVAAQLQIGNASVATSKESNTHKMNTSRQSFGSLLTAMQQSETKHVAESHSLTKDDISKIRSQLNKILEAVEEKLDSGEMVLQKNSDLLKQLTELQELLQNSDSKALTKEQMLKGLKEFMSRLEEDLQNDNINENVLSQLSEYLTTQTDNQMIDMLQVPIYPIEGINPSKVIDMAALKNQTEQLVNKINQDSLTRSDYKQMLRLLEQWTQVNGNSTTVNGQLLSDLQPAKNAQIWQNLLANYLNKESMQQKNSYTNKVTVKDLQNWLMRATENYEGSTKTDSSQMKSEMMSQLGQPVQSKVQQYVIHLNHTNSDQSQIQKQLIDQFQQIMSNSKFMKLANGTNQLTIKLHPEHLGDISVKLTQLNGEMMVKMMVQSQGAKELLEGNLTQLRHLFSPQQVTIEKLDPIQSSNQENIKEDNQPNEEDQSQQSHHQQEGDEQANDEKYNFHDMLMDAKV